LVSEVEDLEGGALIPTETSRNFGCKDSRESFRRAPGFLSKDAGFLVLRVPLLAEVPGDKREKIE
jgi:hypothetical protein